MTDSNHAKKKSDAEIALENAERWNTIMRERKAYAAALKEIARGEVNGFELQQIAIRALAGDYNEV